MTLYTYKGELIAAGGALAGADGLCCGACCVDGECSNATKCECASSSGTFHAGKQCSEVNCSSSSDSSYDSSSSYSSDYGACCVATQGPPTYSSSCWSSSSCSTVSDPYDPKYGQEVCETVVECDTVEVPGAISYTCTEGAEYECYIKGGIFYQGKLCGQIWCGDGSSSGSGGGDSSNISSSSKSSGPSRRGGWVCKPVWVCKKECDDDNPCKTRCELTVELALIPMGECPPGFTLDNGVCRNVFNVDDCADCDISAEVTQWLTDNNLIGLDGDIQRHCSEPICCGGKCCTDLTVTACCGNNCLPPDHDCCDGEIRDPEKDNGCCTQPDGTKTNDTKANCLVDPNSDWVPCDCPCPDSECEWVYERDAGSWRLGEPDGVDVRNVCLASGCDCPEPDFTPGEGAPIIFYNTCEKQQAAQQLRTINKSAATIYICDN